MTELQFSQSGADEEIAFWRGVFEGLGQGKNQYLRDWLNPNRPLVPEAAQHIAETASLSDPVVLDLGCGPVSVLGYRLARRSIQIIGVDPLAEEYTKLCEEYNVPNPLKLKTGLAETLDGIFPAETFDYINCTNALDHCYDPRLALTNIVRVLRNDCVARIEVFVNEAEFAAYTGFHQWNFDVLKDRIIVWNRNEIMFLDDLIDGNAYRFVRQNKYIGDSKILRETLTIEIHKVDTRGQQVEIGHGVAVSYVQRRGLLFFERSGEIEPANFFVHYLGVGEKGFESAGFRWPAPYKKSFLWMPSGVAGVRIGQFHQYYDHQNVVYSNIWAENLPSSLFSKSQMEP